MTKNREPRPRKFPVTPESEAAYDASGSRGLLSGTLAASMERIARLTAETLPASSALVVMLGGDRRAFGAGPNAKPWFAHDSGALIRFGITRRVMEEGGYLAIADCQHSREEIQLAAAELGLASFAICALGDRDGAPVAMLCAFRDAVSHWTDSDRLRLDEFAALATTELELRHLLSEREVRERQLRHDSQHDALTGLPNRAYFMRRLGDATDRSRRMDDTLFAVVFLDLDDFKLINDSMGHHVGDEVIMAVARRLEECVRGGDIVARLGGDEFAILLERVADARDTAIVAERVQEALSKPFNVGGFDHRVTASIGVALSSSANERPEYLLRSADMAMYRAKSAGRNRFEMFDRAMHAEALARLQIENELRRAVDNQEFMLYYQPIVSLASGRIEMVEALIRWRHQERGVVAPADFVTIAEETGLIIPMGRWALREACRQIQAWQEELAWDEPIGLSVNLSVRQFGQIDLVRTVAATLKETQLAPASLHLEITESAIISQSHPAVNIIHDLRALGVAIHLDDFGTGYSSLSYLHRIPLDAIKIDRAFTSAIDSENLSREVVRAILGLVRAVGVEAIAEGVTSETQVEVLRELGCEFAQGYLFSRPLPPDEIRDLLNQRHIAPLVKMGVVDAR
ncbi:MAG: putative bifunctional diguanylate cyclase/phosphodiesterase [Gemmatimonadaceae bacterium]